MGSSRFDSNPVIQSLMRLGPSMEELLLLSSDSEADSDGGGLGREEARLEREIVKVIQSGDWEEALRPNSGQAVAVGDHHVCVGFHHDTGSDYRVWEWHGHIMLFCEDDDDDDDHDVGGGYSPEYIYGNYFQKLPTNQPAAASAAAAVAGVGGLRDLISDENTAAATSRVLHRHVNAFASK